MKRLLSILLTAVAATAAADTPSLVVTRADDVTDPSDGRTTLREAFDTARKGLLSPDQDGLYRITFGDALFTGGVTAVTVELNAGATVEITNAVRLCGRPGVTVRAKTAAAALTVRAGAPFEMENLTVDFATDAFTQESDGTPKTGIFVTSEGCLTWRGCTFSGSGSKNGCLVKSAGSKTDWGAVLEGCSFVGERCGTLALGGLRRYRLVNCTFADITASSNYGVVSLGGANDCLVVNSTICNCKTARGGLRLLPSLTCRPHVVNSIITCNRDGSDRCDVKVESSDSAKATFAYVAYEAVSGESYVTQVNSNCTVLAKGSESSVFAGKRKSVSVSGVLRHYRALRRGGGASGKGCYVFHDAAWTNVACCASLRYQQSTRTTLLGSSELASVFLDRDIVTRLVAELPVTYRQLYAASDLRAVPGSYAALTVIEEGACGTIAVNDATDRADGAFDLYDDAVSLREAISFASTHPEWRDADGNCTVTFDSGFFGNVRGRILTLAHRQIEITGVTNGTLVIRGPSDGRRSVMIDGSDAYRLFLVGAGNRARFENVTFARGSGQIAGEALVTSGGAILNAGTLLVSNAVFRGCAGLGSSSSGGAVYTGAGATSVVLRCTFESCSAGRGGALAAADDAVLTAASSTFLDNTAHTADGGAVSVSAQAARTALVGCTFTGNRAATRGGAVACGAAVRTLFLADDLLVGNAAGLSDADLYAAGETPTVACWYGTRNDARVWNLDVDVAGGKMVADVFSRVGSDGGAQAVTQVTAGVSHRVLPLLKGTTYPSRWIRHDETWDNLGYAETTDGEVTSLYGDLPPIRLQLTGYLLDRDQLGGSMGAVAAIGAVATYETPQGRIPVSGDDPLAVTTADFTAFRGALDHAALHPNLASNGYVTVRFLPGLTIPFDATVEVKAFSGTAGLRLVGPVTFDGQNGVRLFKLAERNVLRLENVTIANGRADGSDDSFGGAVLCNDARLEASNCVFRACRAGQASAAYAYGGAVEYRDTQEGCVLASGDFTDCSFEDCAAQGAKTAAQILYRASAATALRNCRYNGADKPAAGDVADNLRARIDRPGDADVTTNRLYFGTFSAALDECRRGDTLVRLDANVVIPKELRWPDGVSFVDETALNDEKGGVLLAAARANLSALAASEDIDGVPRYCVRETSTGVCLALNASAVEPDLTGPGAEVDLGSSDATEVTVVPASVVSGLWYGLGRSTGPEGPYVVSPGGWVRAEADGLPQALTAPKAGESGFYRVMVRE